MGVGDFDLEGDGDLDFVGVGDLDFAGVLDFVGVGDLDLGDSDLDLEGVGDFDFGGVLDFVGVGDLDLEGDGDFDFVGVLDFVGDLDRRASVDLLFGVLTRDLGLLDFDGDNDFDRGVLGNKPSFLASFGLIGVGERRFNRDLFGVLFGDESIDTDGLAIDITTGLLNIGFSPFLKGVALGNFLSNLSGLNIGPKDTLFLLLAGDSQSSPSFRLMLLSKVSFLGEVETPAHIKYTQVDKKLDQYYI